MSRRRATEEAIDPDDSLPFSNKSSADGKQRTIAERAGRFFRNRPVSSLLLVLGLFSLALITYSLGRIVGRTLFNLLSSTTNTSIARNSENASVVSVGNYGVDEHGVLVHGVNGQRNAEELTDDRLSSNSSTRVCYRKFEPGRLGWSKTLCVTDEFYFDIRMGTTNFGRLKIGVFGDVVPKSTANFRSLATCTGVFSDTSLCYRGDTIHRVVTNFVIQGGSKATGRSIYGPTFREEKDRNHHSFLSHDEKGVVSWAEYPIGSQFFVLLRNDAKYLDKNHVVFGVVTEGLDVVDKIHDAPRVGEEPSKPIKIIACGDAHKHR